MQISLRSLDIIWVLVIHCLDSAIPLAHLPYLKFHGNKITSVAESSELVTNMETVCWCFLGGDKAHKCTCNVKI